MKFEEDIGKMLVSKVYEIFVRDYKNFPVLSFEMWYWYMSVPCKWEIGTFASETNICNTFEISNQIRCLYYGFFFRMEVEKGFKFFHIANNAFKTDRNNGRLLTVTIKKSRSLKINLWKMMIENKQDYIRIENLPLNWTPTWSSSSDNTVK